MLSFKFCYGVVSFEGLPKTDYKEIVFIGRSNVGKSSLINAIANNRSVARISKNPGATKQLNFFLCNDSFFLVDVPGYGYARAAKSTLITWSNLIRNYLMKRPQLEKVFLLIDSRRGFKESDIEMLQFLGNCGVIVQIIMTKSDKLKSDELNEIHNLMNLEILKYGICLNNIIITNVKSMTGIEEVRQILYNLI